MAKGMLRIAVRHLRKRKGYALLNILGLTAGIACCLLIFEYVAYERSYENFNPRADRIVRVQDEQSLHGQVVPYASAMSALAPTLKRDFPEVEDACRLRHSALLLSNDVRSVRFRETRVFFADPGALFILAVGLRRGDPHTALSGPGKVLLSVSAAARYFGGEDPLGKTPNVRFTGNNLPLEVTGVFEEYPGNSHVHFDVLVSYKTLSVLNGTYAKPDDPVETSWGWTDFYTYVLLKEGVDRKGFAAKLPAFIDKYYNRLPENLANKDNFHLTLFPLRDIHLSSHYTEEAEANGDGQAVRFLLLIGFFIIGIAWINYINLSTARSLERAREVGVRKVLGAVRAELIRQFMTESLLLNGVALILAVLAVIGVNPLFAALTGRATGSLSALPGNYRLYFAAVFVLGTLLSGMYPALVLSRYRPVAVLKGLFKDAAGGHWLRKGLIVGQFAASIILIAGTIIVYQQVSFMRSKGLGVDLDQTLVLRGSGSAVPDSSYRGIFDAFKDEVLHVPGVKSLTASSNVMGEEILWSTDWQWLANPAGKRAKESFMLGVDEHFIGSFGIRIVAGRNFSSAYASDRRAVLINESAVKTLGFPSASAALDQLVSGGQDGMDSLRVVGVVADFHHEGLQKAIQPLVFLPNRDRRAHYSIKLSATDVASKVAAIKGIWDRYFHGDPYTYFFLDEFFSRQYAENERFGKVFALFALIAVTIACFGLLGLSAYNVLQRTKEIGIRKVLGASTGSLLYLLSRDFLVLVGVAFLLAVPVTWMVMDGWLRNFAYRIGISWWVFGLAGLASMLFAFVTVSGQAVRAALANPINALRSE